MDKTYLGDGVYVEYNENEAIEGITLSTERNHNGISITHWIFLESPVFENLIIFINEMRKVNGMKPIIIPRD